MIHPEYYGKASEIYGRCFGIPFLCLPEGAPVGYGATRSLLMEARKPLRAGPSPTIRMVDEDGKRVKSVLMSIDHSVDSLIARRFTIRGDSSIILPLITWMRGAFCMVLRSVVANDDVLEDSISGRLNGWNCPGALGRMPDGTYDMVFIDSIKAFEGRVTGGLTSFVKVRLPRGRALDLLGRCLIGRPGCRYI